MILAMNSSWLLSHDLSRDRVTTSFISYNQIFVFHFIARLHLVEELVVFYLQENGHYVIKVKSLTQVFWDIVHPSYYYIIGFNKGLSIYTMISE